MFCEALRVSATLVCDLGVQESCIHALLGGGCRGGGGKQW